MSQPTSVFWETLTGILVGQWGFDPRSDLLTLDCLSIPDTDSLSSEQRAMMESSEMRCDMWKPSNPSNSGRLTALKHSEWSCEVRSGKRRRIELYEANHYIDLAILLNLDRKTENWVSPEISILEPTGSTGGLWTLELPRKGAFAPQWACYFADLVKTEAGKGCLSNDPCAR